MKVKSIPVDQLYSDPDGARAKLIREVIEFLQLFIFYTSAVVSFIS